VVDGLILETTFLIDLEREISRPEAGPAQALLERHAQASLFLTFTITGELAAGWPPGERQRWEEFVAPFAVLACTPDVCWEYGKAFRYLKENGLLIGANDLWIAATGLAFGLPVVTRDTDHYRRVPHLEVIAY
jgi:predicted nucleic acid-binding protein